MFNKKQCTVFCYKKTIIKNIKKIFKKNKINTPILHKDIYIHNGINFTRRVFNELFISRANKFNIFFKKPLSRPLKKQKK